MAKIITVLHCAMKHVNIFPMKTASGSIEEIFLDGSARIACPPELIPAPGQYLLAHASASDSPLPVSLFSSLSTPHGFRSAPPIPSLWRPGDKLTLRGPLGHGFSVPSSSRRMALIAFDDAPTRLLGLIPLALKQNMEIVLVCDIVGNDIPEVVEVQPLKALKDVLTWADYAAVDIARENLEEGRKKIGFTPQAKALYEAQILIRTSMPCGALADCGVCAIIVDHEWKMICKDGPVFNFRELQ